MPTVVVGGALLFPNRYGWLGACVTLLSCLPFLLRLRADGWDARRLVLLACMVALTVGGRFLFGLIPGFKPVTAMVVITALSFGPEAGFLTGALSALLSNFVFGQGIWTPYQMFSWGIIGLLAGVFAGPIRRHYPLLAVCGVCSGLLYSLLMDSMSLLLYNDGTTYLALVLTSLPATATYIVSDVFFLLVLAGPIGKVIDRLQKKYDLNALETVDRT